MRVVFGKQVILKGMGTEALSEEFTDDDSIYGRVFLPAAPSRIPVSAVLFLFCIIFYLFIYIIFILYSMFKLCLFSS